MESDCGSEARLRAALHEMRYTDAGRIACELLDEDDCRAQAHLALAMIDWDRLRQRESQRHAQTVMELARDDPTLNAQACRFLPAEERMVAALHLVGEYPHSVAAQIEYALALSTTGSTADAVSRSRTAFERWRTDDAALAYGLCLAAAGHTPAAAEWLEWMRSASADPHSPARLELALLARRLLPRDEAQPLADRLAASYPQSVMAQLAAVTARYSVLTRRPWMEPLERALSLAPDSSLVIEAAVALELQSGRYPSAMRRASSLAEARGCREVSTTVLAATPATGPLLLVSPALMILALMASPYWIALVPLLLWAVLLALSLRFRLQHRQLLDQEIWKRSMQAHRFFTALTWAVLGIAFMIHVTGDSTPPPML